MMLEHGPGVFWTLPEKDFAPSRHLVGEQRGDMGTLKLQRGESISGKLMDVNGKPVAGVYLHADSIARVQGFTTPISDQSSRWAISDANGEFKMEPLPPGKYRLQTSDEYVDLSGDRGHWPPRHVPPAVFLPTEVTLVEGQPSAPVELRAVPEELIEAQVVDSQGKPRGGICPGISGLFQGKSFNPRAEISPQGKITARAPRGMDVAMMSVLTDQNTSVRWRLGKDKPWKNGRSIELGPVGDGISGVEIMHYRAPTVFVKVVDQDGKTRKEADVTAFYAKGVVPSSTITQKRSWLSEVAFDERSDGHFRSASVLPDEEITVTAYADGLASPPQKIKLGEGEQKEITLVLDKAAPGQGPISANDYRLELKVDTGDEETEKPNTNESPKAEVQPEPDKQ
jgi:hypothetical protein